VFDALFPMYVVRAVDVLSMTEVRAHQRLMADGLLVAFDPGSAVAVFVSHQWAARHHPDPAFAQFKTLQRLLCNALSGSLRVEVDLFQAMSAGMQPSISCSDLQLVGGDLSIWYDYFSVPQLQDRSVGADSTDAASDMGKAVMSIPAYVERSRFFVILAPEVEHVDVSGRFINYASWRSRGWCRLERAVRILSPGESYILLATTGELLQEVGLRDWFFDPPCEGTFAVEDDKLSIIPIIDALKDRLLSGFLRDGLLQEFRMVKAMGPLLWKGCPIASRISANVEEANGDPTPAFLEAFAFPALSIMVQSQAMLNEALLRAAAAGNEPVVGTLLGSAANLQAEELLDNRPLAVFRGFSALHYGASVGHEAMVAALLERRAAVNACDQAYGATPVLYAAMASSIPVLRMLLDHAAQVNQVARRSGVSALAVAVMLNREANVRELLAHGARSRIMLHVAAMCGSGEDIIRSLLETADGPSPNQVFRPPWNSAQNAVFSVLALPHLWGGGASPLHVAAMYGFRGEARFLLQSGANAGARNDYGATAADLSALFGHSPQHQAVFQGIPSPQSEDRGLARAEQSVGAAPLTAEGFV